MSQLLTNERIAGAGAESPEVTESGSHDVSLPKGETEDEIEDEPLEEENIPEDLKPLYNASHELARALAKSAKSTFIFVAEVIFHVSESGNLSNDDIRRLAKDYFVDALIKCNSEHLPYDRKIWRSILSTPRYEGIFFARYIFFHSY